MTASAYLDIPVQTSVAPSASKICPQCGARLFADMDVCYQCFHRFESPSLSEGLDPWQEYSEACWDPLDLFEAPFDGESGASLPWEYGGPEPFYPEDAEVDEADETCDLVALREPVSYGLRVNWRGLEATIAVPSQGLTIGRASSCDVILRDSAVSRRHVQVVVEDGMMLVADLGSVNPALLDGKPVEVCEPWLPGSVLNLCGAHFSLIMLDPRE